MAILFCDSFKHYTSVAHMLRKYPTSPSTVNWGSFSVGRFTASGAMTVTSGGLQPLYRDLPSAQSTVVIGLSALVTAGATFTSANAALFSLYDGSTLQVSWQFGSDGNLRVYRGLSTAILAQTTTGTAIRLNAWARYELWVTFHGSTGVVDVRVDGVSVCSATGLNTAPSGVAQCTRYLMQGSIGGVGLVQGRFEDVVVTNNTAPNAGFLGDVRIHVLAPTGAGTYSESDAPTGVANRWDAVDDTNPDDDTTYNAFSASGQRNTYATANLPASAATVYGVQVVGTYRKDDAGVNAAAAMIRSGSTDAESSPVTLSASYTCNPAVFDQDPNGTIAWTPTSVNAMEIGTKRTT